MDQILATENNLIEEEFHSKSSSCIDSEDSFLDCFSSTTSKNERINSRRESCIKSDDFLTELNNTFSKNSDHNISGNIKNNISFNREIGINKIDSTVINTLNQQPKDDNGHETVTCAKENVDSILNDNSNTFKNTFKLCDQQSDYNVDVVRDYRQPKCILFPNTNKEIEFSKSMDKNHIENNSCEINEDNSQNNEQVKENSCIEIKKNTKSLLSDIDNSSEKNNEFIPTIVDIRGACADVLDEALNNDISSNLISDALKLSQKNSISVEKSKLSQINIISVQGSVNELNSDNRENDTCDEVSTQKPNSEIIYTIDDTDCMLSENHFEDSSFNAEFTIKQEPADNVVDDDCTYINTEHSSNYFTSEIFIKEEKTINGENGELEVYCIETSSKIPSPIPIKTEANVENEKQSGSSNVNIHTHEKNMSVTIPKKADEYLTLSSESERDDSSDSKERSKFSKSHMYSKVGYTCHLCNTIFQEHELLNEHMILHRNNCLIETKVQNKIKPKTKVFTCQTCNKRLSTWQSLQQHTMIHNNEKPHVCSICNKDFRHLSNFRMHLQKHSEEQSHFKEREILKNKGKLDKSVVRAVDFGRLVGPLFMKETLLNQKNKEVEVKKIMQSRSLLPSRDIYSKLSFDKPIIKVRDNTKENKIIFKKNSDVKEKIKDELEDDIIPLKTFNNVENIVMNAARFIVKLDNLDPNQLKRKIKTPDISIDKPLEKKRRIVPFPTQKNQRVKLDQIENIIMDVTCSDYDMDDTKYSTANQTKINLFNNDEEDYMRYNCIDYDNEEERKGKTEKWDTAKANSMNKESLHGTLTDNELFELLNDDRETISDHPQRDYMSELRNNAQRIFKQESENAKNLKFNIKITAKSNSCTAERKEIKQKSSNVVLLQCDSFSQNSVVKLTNSTSSSSECDFSCTEKPRITEIESTVINGIASDLNQLKETTSITWFDSNDIENECEKYDNFDSAFHKVAVRRLILMKKRAAQNNGKLENKYLLGPLFWRKALHRAKQNQIEANLEVPMMNSKSLLTKRFDNRTGKSDDRRTNDPTKLQIRAENKLKCVLDKARMMSDLNNLDLIGPLFWKRTLKLAGIRNSNDLKTLFDEEQSPSLTEIQFVDENELNEKPFNEIFSQANKKSSTDDIVETDSTTLFQTRYTNEEYDNKNMQLNEKNIVTDEMFNDDLEKSNYKSSVSKSDSQSEDIYSNSIKRIHNSASKCVINIETNETPSNFKNNVKVDSILYDSLTKPRSCFINSEGDKVRAIFENSLVNEKKCEKYEKYEEIIFKENHENIKNNNQEWNEKKSLSNNKAVELETNNKSEMEQLKKQDSKLSTRLTERFKTDVTDVSRTCSDSFSDSNNEEESNVSVETGVDSNNIILNVDGDFQLLASDHDKSVDGSNYVLVSDETGVMQYVVNVQEENYGNFKLISNANDEQFAYALQFDGENYTAVQFVQGNMELENEKSENHQDLKEDKMNSVSVSVNDHNHIGKELSHFLNLGYSTLTKNENHD